MLKLFREIRKVSCRANQIVDVQLRFSELIPCQGFIAFLLLDTFGQKSHCLGHIRKPWTLSGSLEKKRLELELFQIDVAAVIGVDTMTICNWEKDRGGLELRFIPKIVKFLGSEPPLGPVGERIKHYRYLRGISQEELARRIGVDPSTLGRLERNLGRCLSTVLRMAAVFLDIQ